jgi:hypothetical protein
MEKDAGQWKKPPNNSRFFDQKTGVIQVNSFAYLWDSVTD